MITDKQRQRDFEYEADYKSNSRYSTEQWTNILESGQLSDQLMEYLEDIYASFNHTANLLQISFHRNRSGDEVLACMNEGGQLLGEANGFEPETDFSGNEYWWYIFAWGKNLDEGILEWKLHPELTEAIGSLHPEYEERYYAFMNEADRSLKIRYSQEDSVWIASAALLYEKYYRYPGISTDDILLMQYEVQTRSQKVFGQDIDSNMISVICNADERGHRNNYLRDMYKYYRISYPGEFEGDRERPDPEEVDYTAYIYTLFGYIKLSELYDFVEHEYAHLVDETYVELTGANGFVRLAAFLSRQGGKKLAADDKSEKATTLRADGADGAETFHLISEAMLKEYPNFTYLSKGDWYMPEVERIVPSMEDRLYIENYEALGAFISVSTVTEGDEVNLDVALHLPISDEPEVMADIREKCDKLTLMTTAPFQVETLPASPSDLIPGGEKIVAHALYHYKDFISETEETIIGMISSSLEIFASYYTDICQNYYTTGREARDESSAEALKSALGDKVTIRPASDVPDPSIVYRQTESNPTTDYITRALQGYGGGSPEPSMDEAPAEPARQNESASLSAPPSPAAATAPVVQAVPAAAYSRTAPLSHEDRKDVSFRLYPRNMLIQGPMKTGKYHEAIMYAVGIIEGKDRTTLSLEPVSDILAHYMEYVEQGRIVQVSYPDIRGKGYEAFIEDASGREGLFTSFANRCGQGRYVMLIEEADLSWSHLFGETAVLLRENRREGAGSQTSVTLSYSKLTFTLPSNLFIIATCDSAVCEDAIVEAVDLDFFIRHVEPDAAILHSTRVEGISLEQLMTTINLRLSYFLGPDYQLGEGFFLQTPEKDRFTSLCRVFREQIIPVLEKWFDGDIERIRYVLGDNGKTRTDTMFYLETAISPGLFKGQLPDSFDSERKIYQINEAAFYHPASYRAVYEG